MKSLKLSLFRQMLMGSVIPGPLIWADLNITRQRIAEFALARGLTPTPKLGARHVS